MKELVELSESRGVSAVYSSGEEELRAAAAEHAGDVFCVVTLGGDGTILRAVSIASQHGLPVLGVNMGRVGFFSEIGADDFGSALDDLLSGSYYFEEPSMLGCSLNGESMGECLNDFAIHRQELSSITHLGLSIDGESVGEVMADGLIISTPSGSTAYTMSAGGPVVAPKLECILVTPVCPHSLTIRPIVAAKDSVITVVSKCTCRLSRDGQNAAVLEEGDRLVFTSSERTAKFIRFKRRNIFRLIREKLR